MPARRLQRPSLPSEARPFNAVWRIAGGCAAVLCAVLIAYAPALRGGLVWDDESHITSQALQSVHGLWRIWFELGATQQYYPLLHSAFWLEHRIWGDNVLGYHIVNVVLHSVSALLIVAIVRRLKLRGAWLAGFIFALHPVCVEAVAWITQQKSTLSGVFYLASALIYLEFDQTRSKSRYFLALALFLLALLSKTVTASLPAALLVVLWWRRGRLQWRRDVAPLLPWFTVGVPAGLLTAWVERVHIGAQGAEFALSLSKRLLLAGRAPWFYASKVIWPSDLMFSYPKWEVDPGVWWQYLFPAGLLAAATALALLARSRRGPMAGFLFFTGTLFPVLGFLNVYPFRYSYVADHFQYLAMLGIIVPAAAGLTAAAGRISQSKKAAIAAGLAVTVCLGLLTRQQSRMYRDVETLYRETLTRNPHSFFVHLNLGSFLFQDPGRLSEAIAHFEAAVRLRPDSPEAQENLGNALASVPGRLPEAIRALRSALRYKPESADIHNSLGLALASAPGRLDEAVEHFHAAVRINPNLAAAHNNLGMVLASMPGRLPEAIAEYETALRIAPSHVIHNNLGTAYAQIPGREEDAIAHYRAALRLKPDFALAYFNLGNVLSNMPGRLQEAVAEYRSALRIDPQYLEARVNLGITLAQIPGRLPDAISEIEEAVRIRPDLEPTRRLLARLRAASSGVAH